MFAALVIKKTFQILPENNTGTIFYKNKKGDGK